MLVFVECCLLIGARVWAGCGQYAEGLPPPMRVCGASSIMSKLELLQPGFRAWEVVISIRLGVVRLLLGLGPCDPGLALVGVVLGDGSLVGVCGQRGSMSFGDLVLFLGTNGEVVRLGPRSRV